MNRVRLAAIIIIQGAIRRVLAKRFVDRLRVFRNPWPPIKQVSPSSARKMKERVQLQEEEEEPSLTRLEEICAIILQAFARQVLAKSFASQMRDLKALQRKMRKHQRKLTRFEKEMQMKASVILDSFFRMVAAKMIAKRLRNQQAAFAAKIHRLHVSKQQKKDLLKTAKTMCAFLHACKEAPISSMMMKDIRKTKLAEKEIVLSQNLLLTSQ